jgi:NAD+ diphosphatase
MVLICPSCTHHAYPRISPCIITLVEDGDRILLAHNARFDENRFSTLAGFVEAGESVEQAVAREIKEEVGVDIGEFRYFKSQAWPFPDSLMLAFFAQYQGGELQPDGVEITEARWFTRDELNSVTLPPKFSISRQLIDDWVNRSS